MKKFPHYKQPDAKDCGPTCLRIIAKHYGKTIPIQQIRNLSETTREGSSLLGLSEAAENMGFKTLGVKIDFITLQKEAPLPCIVHWNKEHFVVVYNIKKSIIHTSKSIIQVSDPAYGLIDYSVQDFIQRWIGANADETTEEGIALLIEPTPKFKQTEWDDEKSKTSFSFLYQYLFRYKSLVAQLVLGLGAASLLTLIFPFLTQSIVDIGIQNQDLNFIYLVLFAQVMLFIGRSAIEVIRGWILLHLSTRINISLVSDFFIKLMNLPIGYFDTRMTGDIMQRINDHSRIENLLTGSTLSTLFSMVNLLVFSMVLAYYDWRILSIFLSGSALYIIWILFFLKKRRELDYKRFSQVSQEQSKVIELINGMQEIKLHNAEKQKRWDWEFVQVKLFKINMKSLSLEQTQGVGSSFINEMKNILITFMSASLVLSGNITLGMMLSVQYIIGQLNQPLMQLVGFIRQVQDAKISLERLSEIHDKEDEETPEDQKSKNPIPADIILENLSFRYTGSPDLVIKNLDLKIPLNHTTAIVGASGSGKSTLMKLLMMFYDPNAGKIKLGTVDFRNISQKAWRSHCGVVMQEGYIFNDTIANNIAVGDSYVDKEKLRKAVEIANIKDFIESLPLSYNTKIGNEGIGISGGQKQRLLIARAVYKNPDFIYFDEATSSLDANNEKIIMDNLNEFFKGRTAIVIAHRLSTVKNADQIVVMDSGQIAEKGTHQELLDKRGMYYNLVKNQLEMERLND
ncbi:MAG: peptidase domain-containing ABC transporter [Flavobacteriaceae bacterium]|nr:peptidase domain-containing ABC transporter [Flavobacteriaceae bacterium]